MIWDHQRNMIQLETNLLLWFLAYIEKVFDLYSMFNSGNLEGVLPAGTVPGLGLRPEKHNHDQSLRHLALWSSPSSKPLWSTCPWWSSTPTWPGTVATILMSGSADVLALGLEPDLKWSFFDNLIRRDRSTVCPKFENVCTFPRPVFADKMRHESFNMRRLSINQ